MSEYKYRCNRCQQIFTYAYPATSLTCPHCGGFLHHHN